MELINSKTYQNLAKSFAGETMARTRYEFVEYGARQQGQIYLAKLIDEIAYQEFNHARMLYTFIQTAKDGVIPNVEVCSGFPFREKWNLVENLKLAADDEKDEVKIYAEYEKVAKDEGFKDIAGLFRNLGKIESMHQKTFEKLHARLADGSLYKRDEEVVWKCSGCGHEAKGKEAWKECPVCQAKQGAVMFTLE